MKTFSKTELWLVIVLAFFCFPLRLSAQAVTLPYDASADDVKEGAQNATYMAYPSKLQGEADKIYDSRCGQGAEGLGSFSVSATTKVVFSSGNLQYVGTWQFAEHQWDYFGTSQFDNHRDLFGWGTGNAPNKVSTSYSDYSTFTDWGINQIGGDAPGTWRTLTKDEWGYLFHGRTNYAQLFGLGTVNGVSGTIILPDDWVLPAGLTFSPSTSKGLSWSNTYYYNSGGNNFSHNRYTSAQWEKMEAAGAVFLPCAGRRDGTSVNSVGSDGYYWSATPNGANDACYLYFGPNYLNPQASKHNRYYGFPVRLVSGL